MNYLARLETKQTLKKIKICINKNKTKEIMMVL